MSKPDDRNLIDDQALEEYLRRGAQVSQRYRQASDEEPPAALDQRVLDAAREAASRRAPSKSRPQWMRWSAPLAIAASAVLVVSIILESGVHKETALVSAPAQPATKAESAPEPALHDHAEYERVYAAPADAPADAGIVAPAAEATRTEVTTVAKRREEKAEQPTPIEVDEQPQFAAAPPAVAVAAPSENASQASSESRRALASPTTQAAPARDDGDLSQVIVTGAERPREAARRIGPRSTVRPSTADSTPADSAGEQMRDPEDWLEDIRALRAAGRDDEADAEWRRFRNSYPDYVVHPGERARPAREPAD